MSDTQPSCVRLQSVRGAAGRPHDRTRDWADIEAMVAAGTVDLDEVRATMGTMLAPTDPRFARLDEAERRGGVES